ncbi:MAG: carotenoid biosynthesis protein [Mariniphaga sp.]|nr:carotenoid biosynthesis protein [Mariniphaga sp.]
MKNRKYTYSFGFLIIFYLVGIAGFINPSTREFFSRLTPLALLLSAGFLIWFHRPKFTLKMGGIFAFIFIFSFLVEAIGVKTGLIFGEYIYGKGLGIKVLETPLMIGLNWLMLVYCTKIIAEKISENNTVKLFFAPFLMVIYDFILEQAAPLLGMWSWAGGKIPLQNYISWYLLAFLFHWLLQKTKTEFSNQLAAPVFVIQFMFFVVLVIYFLIFEI